MHAGLQLTSITTLTGVICMLGAWLIASRRSRQSNAPVIRQVKLLNSFFISFATFFAIVWLPHLSLYTQPWLFPMLMAWGYVVGHIFLYIGFIFIGRLLLSMIPRLASKERIVPIVGAVAITAVTIFNAVTMIWGTLPAYDYQNHVTQFNANPLVGAAIGIMGALTLLPTGILFLRNAIKSQGSRRTRSLLLGTGFIVMLMAGPPHDIAGTWQVYMVADILVIVGVIITAAGVIYRFDQSFALEAPRPAARSAAAVPPAV